MERALIDGVELKYTVHGAGDPVVLVHPALFPDGFAPLLGEPTLTERYRVVQYRRAGYGGSARVAGPLSLADQAGHCRALLRHLAIERAHVVGHSSGGCIALQFALDAPAAVHSLALLEPALTSLPGMPPAPPPFVVEAVQRHGAGDSAGAVEAFMRGVAGPAYRTVLDAQLPPGAFERAVADADTFFAQELPAIRSWPFARDEAARIDQPVLAVIGERSSEVSPMFEQRQRALLEWLPHAEAFTLPGAGHLLHAQNARGMAEGLADFFARHPLSVE